ncbi:SCO family protein [Modestobacter sp. VKM Ac-2985]|uniref:SCO family protein n=1 Tax=Modestobacter sp. VKM Ac-2985 TaxID=3004139 RepID=UPI0022AB56B0|nr:SCO family protein [Modestobacter sp. VKM Ac-2985]MCZ2836755.1 SCO family protein [Modestobacter sp. VKM Ac-2985]
MSAVTHPARTGLTALTLATGLLLAGCGGDADADASAEATGHDHGSAEAPATLEGGVREGGIQLADPYQKPDFTLTDTSGAPFDFAEQTAAGPTLLFFGFTNCPDICPTTMADVMLALGEVDPAVAEQTSVVFVTTDPARDTPEVLREYLDRFDAGLPYDFIGLTGDQEQIDQAQLAAGIPVAQNGGESHSALLLLYGTDGEADVAFDSANTPRDIALELAATAG